MNATENSITRGTPAQWDDAPSAAEIAAAPALDEAQAAHERAVAAHAAAETAREEAIDDARRAAAAKTTAMQALATGGTPAAYKKAAEAADVADARVLASVHAVEIAAAEVARAARVLDLAKANDRAAWRAEKIEAICAVLDRADDHGRKREALLADAERMFTASGLRVPPPGLGSVEHMHALTAARLEQVQARIGGAPVDSWDGKLRTLDDVRRVGRPVWRASAADAAVEAPPPSEPPPPAAPPLDRAESQALWRICEIAPDRVRDQVGDFGVRELLRMPELVRLRILPLAAELGFELAKLEAGSGGGERASGVPFEWGAPSSVPEESAT